jgi:hypothetical protein
MVATVVISALVIAGAGAAITFSLILVSWGIQREERGYSLTGQAPGRLSAGARVLTGLYVRQRADSSRPGQRTDLFG